MNDDQKSKHHPRYWKECSLEEHFFGQERKAGKQQRKLASAKDRSKYKKTNQDQLLKHAAKAHEQKLAAAKDTLLRGRVISIVPEGILVDCEGHKYTCLLRGVLKKEKNLDKNLVTVGDFVHFEAASPSEGVIAYVEPRKTVLSRADNLSRRKNQLIAANIDQVIITASVVHPPLKPALLDRYIIAARKGGLEPLIVINKIDLLDDPSMDEDLKLDEKDLYLHLLEVYQQNQIKAIGVSVQTGQGIEELQKAMQGKASVFSGQSGVGKSSLINAVAGLSLKVGEIVEKTKKGAHTTTTAQLLPLTFGGWCIDTPGIKSFGIWNLKLEEIKSYFSEIYDFGRQCHFPNCTHLHESDCAVIQATEQGLISPIRYQSYQSLVQSASQEHLRR